MEIYIAGTRETLLRELREVVSEIERTPEGQGVSPVIYANVNLGEGEATIYFSNDDMEGRPEVATGIYVDVER